MKKVFRNSGPSLLDYACLALFAAVYLAAVAFVISPDSFLSRNAPGSAPFSTH